MGKHSTRIDITEVATQSSTSKRKRDELPQLEVDVSAPEPLSKKSSRRNRKENYSLTAPEAVQEASVDVSQPKAEPDTLSPTDEQDHAGRRTSYGIWVGNLPWSTNKNDLRHFISQYAQIAEDRMTRVHMPAPRDNGGRHTLVKDKPRNKGFAYVDFTDEQSHEEALKLSDKFLDDRRVLIKDALDFNGRPTPDQGGSKDRASRNPPNTRVFVGNLGFDTTHDDLWRHLEQCGELNDLHLATFEDSGKCKGYGWGVYKQLESASAAEKGFIMISKEADNDEDDGNDDSKGKTQRKSKAKKWWVNRYHGRTLRIEFAEDQATRYKKRYGKGKPQKDEHPNSTPSNDKVLQESSENRRREEKSHKRPPPKREKSKERDSNITETRGTKIVFN